MIRVEKLSFCYESSKEILSDITFNFENDKIYGLIGRNGAGKTTFLNCLDGSIKVKNCKVYIGDENYAGIDFLKNPLVLINNDKIFFKKLTVIEHFHLINTKKVNLKNYIDLFDLEEYKDKLPSELSLGTAQRFNIALKLFNSNADVIADEPFNGLDLIQSESIQQYIKKLKNKDRTIIISSHDILSLKEICDEIVFLKDGILTVVDNKNSLEVNRIHELLK